MPNSCGQFFPGKFFLSPLNPPKCSVQCYLVLSRLDENLQTVYEYTYASDWSPEFITASDKFIAVGDFNGTVRYYELNLNPTPKVNIIDYHIRIKLLLTF